MKAVLFLCLLAFMACEKDIIDIGKCIYKDPKVQDLITDVVVDIANHDYEKILPEIKESIPELIKVVFGCFTDTKAIEDKPALSKTNPSPKSFTYIPYHCHMRCQYTTGFSQQLCYNSCF